jgi:DNA helicase-2/ATP-dependent DNA helicase PcrA
VSERIAYPDQIMAVTFTNKAAQEMRERVERLLDTDCRAMWISTFHALCARLLRREAHHIGLSRDFTIYDSADQQAVIKQLLKEHHLADETYQPRMVLGRISHAKNRMEGPESFEATWNPRDREICASFFTVIRRRSPRRGARLRRTAAEDGGAVRPRAGVRERYARRFRFVMVDEYQDTNRPQYLLIKQLAGVHRNLCVVGDPDQSIYKWRGADLRNIMDFEQDFSEAVVVRLERNYRSTQVILDAASAVIANNRNRKEKILWTDQKGGAKITASAAPTSSRRRSSSHAHRPAVHPRRCQGRDGGAVPDERAVGRWKTHCDRPASHMVLGGVGFYERKEIKDALSYLKLILNPHDDVAFRRVVNTPPRGIGKGVMDALEQVDAGQVPDDLPPLLAGLQPTVVSNSLWSKLVTAMDQRLLSLRQLASLAAFRDLLTACPTRHGARPVRHAG